MGQFYSPSIQTTKEAKEIRQKKDKRKKKEGGPSGPHRAWSARHKIVDQSFLSVRSMRPTRELFAPLALASVGEAVLGLSANGLDAWERGWRKSRHAIARFRSMERRRLACLRLEGRGILTCKFDLPCMMSTSIKGMIGLGRGDEFLIGLQGASRLSTSSFLS
jgi:hypothetical protein